MKSDLWVPNISENQLHSSENPTLAGERVKKPTDVKSFWVTLHMHKILWVSLVSEIPMELNSSFACIMFTNHISESQTNIEFFVTRI